MARENRLSLAVSSVPTAAAISASGTLMSWPLASLVAGAKIGSASFSDSLSPAGSAIPETAPVFWYSFHPEPER